MTKTSYVPDSAKIKVIGLGGRGYNTVTHMVREQIRGVEFIALNTDTKHLAVAAMSDGHSSQVAEQGILNLIDKVDTLVIILNDRLFTFHDHWVQKIERLLKGNCEPEIGMPLFLRCQAISKIAI